MDFLMNLLFATALITVCVLVAIVILWLVLASYNTLGLGWTVIVTAGVWIIMLAIARTLENKS